MPSVRRQNAWQQPLSNKGNVEKENHIDTITKFLEDLRKLGEQLSYIQEEQKNLLARMLNLKQQEGTETQEYAQLAARSKDLQAQIDKYRPIYEERMAWIKEIKKKRKKRYMQSLGKLIDLPKIIDPRGNLTVAQQYAQVPFGIRRVYWTYDVPSGESRGGHAHRHCREFVIAVSGSFDVRRIISIILIRDYSSKPTSGARLKTSLRVQYAWY